MRPHFPSGPFRISQKFYEVTICYGLTPFSNICGNRSSCPSDLINKSKIMLYGRSFTEFSHGSNQNSAFFPNFKILEVVKCAHSRLAHHGMFFGSISHTIIVRAWLEKTNNQQLITKNPSRKASCPPHPSPLHSPHYG
jgi:hypothetical protein